MDTATSSSSPRNPGAVILRAATAVILAAVLGSCATASGTFKKDRATAQAAGGTTWSNFVIKNLSRMDSHLSYEQQAKDVESAVTYASPDDKQFLIGVKNRILRDKAGKAQLAAQTPTNSAFDYSNSGSSSSSGSYAPSTSSYTPSSSSGSPVSQTQQRQDTTDFNSMINNIEHGTATRTGNPYMR